MIIKRKNIGNIFDALHHIKENEKISLSNKYYILKLISELEKEIELGYQLMKELGDKYGEPVENGIKIKEENTDVVKKQIDEFNEVDITVPDVYFSLDTFEGCDLTWAEIEALMPFIK